MSRAIADALSEVDRVRRVIGQIRSSQIFSEKARGDLRSVAQQYFQSVRPTLAPAQEISDEIAVTDSAFKDLLALSRRAASKEKCLRLLKEARAAIAQLEAKALTLSASRPSDQQMATDILIVESLQDICPSAALSYRQALEDLRSKDRLSYRGPATDLREALRETLDVLAPDSDVMAAPGYKHEPDAKRPTMKQKARYVLRNRGFGASQLSVPEGALEGIEEILGGIVRSVYTRSSVSTHVATERNEVSRVHAWVRLVLCELLEIPL